MNSLVKHGVGLVQNYPIFTAVSTSLSGLIAIGAWAVANQEKIVYSANTAMAVKDCVLNNKIKVQRDSCFHVVDYLKNSCVDLQELNIYDYNQTKNTLARVVRKVDERNSAFQWIFDLNQRTQNVWNSWEEETKKDMMKRGVIPGSLSLQNIPKSAADMVIWIQETRDCTNKLKVCLNEKDKCVNDRDLAIQSSLNDKDTLVQCTKECKQESDSLIERKGECKQLEQIKEVYKKCLTEIESCKDEKNNINTNYKLLEKDGDACKEKYENLKKEKDSCKEEKNKMFTDYNALEKDRDAWKKLYENLKKEYDESQKSFLGGLTGW
jgi:chromosome segregation ATPase